MHPRCIKVFKKKKNMLTLNVWIIVPELNLISTLLPLKLQTYQYMLQLVRFFHSKGKVKKQRIKVFTQHPECIIWQSHLRMSYYSKAVHFHRYETVKSGTDSECYNPLCFIKHNCHCQKWQNVWVRGDPRECVPRLARVCEGNSLVPSLSPCFCVVRVCWSYREFCAAVHYSSVSQAEQCSPPVPDLKTLPRVCVCMRTHTSALCSCECVDVFCEYYAPFSQYYLQWFGRRTWSGMG